MCGEYVGICGYVWVCVVYMWVYVWFFGIAYCICYYLIDERDVRLPYLRVF